jgi:type IV pilus assembly protein PilM
MSWNIFEKSQNTFGLHLSASALKFIQLSNDSKVKVISYGYIQLPKNTINNEAIMNSSTLTHFISEHTNNPDYGRLTTNRVVASLPETKSFVRLIHIPIMSESEAETAVMFEAESYVPLPMDQVYFDWQIGGVIGDRMEVLIVASPKEFVDSYIKVLEKSGLKISALEVESQSLTRALVAANSKETCLIVDTNDYKTTFVLVENGSLKFTSSVSIGGNAFTEKVAQSLDITKLKAEKIKLEVGLGNTPEFPNLTVALQPVLESLITEIKNVLKFHLEHGGKPVEIIKLSGGNAKLKNFEQYLKPNFADYPNLEIKLAEPWQSIDLAQPAPLDSYQALSFSTAIGLSLRRF